MCAIRNVLGRSESSLAFDTSNVTDDTSLILIIFCY